MWKQLNGPAAGHLGSNTTDLWLKGKPQGKELHWQKSRGKIISETGKTEA